MIPLAVRVNDVAGCALALDPWTRVAIRDRLAALAADHPAQRHLLQAAAMYLAAVSDSGEQAENAAGTVFYLMPADPLAFAGVLAWCEDFDELRAAVTLALVQQDAATGAAARWWQAFAHALAAAAAHIADADALGDEIDDWRLE